MAILMKLLEGRKRPRTDTTIITILRKQKMEITKEARFYTFLNSTTFIEICYTTRDLDQYCGQYFYFFLFK